MTTQNFKTGGDGTYVINGCSWTIANTANSSAFALTNGVGLGGTSTAGGIGWNGSSYLKTAPVAYVQVLQLLPQISTSSRLRVKIWNNINNYSTSYEICMLMVGPELSNIQLQNDCINRGGIGIQVQRVTNSSVSNIITTTTNKTNDCLVLDLHSFIGDHTSGFSAAYGVDWVPDTALYLLRAENPHL